MLGAVLSGTVSSHFFEESLLKNTDGGHAALHFYYVVLVFHRRELSHSVL